MIFGGMSTEHQVSIASATSIIKNLDKQKYAIFPIYIDKLGRWYQYTKPVEEIEILTVKDNITEIQPLENPMEYIEEMDVIFPVLHGLYGEDGTIQGMLELLQKKYVGCKVLSSSLCMDKVYAKLLLEKANIAQAKYVYIRSYKDQYIYINDSFHEEKCNINEISDKIIEQLGLPAFVKPSNSGSSVGISKANTREELQKAIMNASQYDRKILIEETIIGREVECAVLGNEDVKASCVGEILSAEQFYTFDAKYVNTQSRTVIPAQISTEVEEQIRSTAKKAYKIADCKGLARVDFFIEDKTNRVILNEINTLPGFTQISMYPKLWQHMGVSYTELLDKLIALALEE